MAHIQQTMNSKILEAAAGRNSLVNDLAQRRVYDSAVEELNARSRRPKVNFSKVVSQEQTLLATDAYPEFEITFYNTQNAVHSFAGGLRALELEYLMMQVPFGSTTYDIGGNFAAHMFKGRDYVHCCMPNLDIRDIARHENQKDSIFTYTQRLERSNKIIPFFQRAAFERFHERPEEVFCNKPFQQCEVAHNKGGRNYAVSLHSLYDIPAAEVGAALLRKDIDVCFAAYHFHESFLLDNECVELEDIGAVFTRDGDRARFFFKGESTLVYEHSYMNMVNHIAKTFFVASNRFVYHKEYMVSRINTWFCKYTKVDTFVLFRGVYSKGADSEQFTEAIDDAWQCKKTLAMLNAERTIFKDQAVVNFWFPKVKDMVIVPLFDASIHSGKLRRSEVMVNKDFVYTVLNHIKTYQAKLLNYQNVLSFVESIRSRVIINGTTARSEWDVDKAVLQPLAMTFFLHTKLSALQDEVVLKKFQKFDKTASSLIWEEVKSFFGDIFPSIRERLVNGGFVKIAENALKIEVPDFCVTFVDKFLTEYRRSEELSTLDVSKPLEKATNYYNALSELSVIENSAKFDVEGFKTFCEAKAVDPLVAAKVVVAILNNEFSLPFVQPTAESVPDAPVREEEVAEPEGLASGDDAPFQSMKNKDRGSVPAQGFTGEKRTFSSDSCESVHAYHLRCVEEVKNKSMAKLEYTGPLKVQQMKNYMDYLSASLSATVSNLCKTIKDVYGADSESKETTGVWDVGRSRWLIQPKDKLHSWGVAELHNHKCIVVLLEWEGDKPICCAEWLKLAVSTDTLIYSDMGKLQTLQSCCRDGEPSEPSGKIVLVDGVPGCGKTKEILERFDGTEDLILVPGKEAAKMIIRRANQSGEIRATKFNVRTVDSFLMHLKPKIYKRLFIDEGLMLHTGCVNFLVQLSGCEVAYVFGDTQQIPFINRVANFPYPAHFATLCYDERDVRSTTLRCPADITHFLNGKYERKVMCRSAVQRSVDAEVLRGSGVLNCKMKPLKGKVITFTQSDKSALLAKGYKDVNTVHEIQGETYEVVSLVRLTPTPLEIVSKLSPHVLVALTRHTLELKYYTVVLDPVCKIISDLSKISSFILEMYQMEAGTQ
uniref:Orf1 n=1 Tax=Ullucus tobamovirus 1 TaxID=2491948 RepID=A0A3G8FWM0_9VIRU|nr:orf1 [Ullucus tobamovirus 1]